MNKFKLITIIKPLIFIPIPSNISYWWNFGSLLGLFLRIQIISGLILSIHYCPNINLAFDRIIHIIQNVNNGWLIHNIHINGASLFFICIYSHIARGIYYSSFKLSTTWLMGSGIFIISIATAFLGYVLPWGQISFWGATVITNLLSTIPIIGPSIVTWLWGGFSINNATLNRFFSLHFIIPFIIILMVIIHLHFLHKTGSSNPIGLNRTSLKIPFHIYFTLKDIFMFLIRILLLTIIILEFPYTLRDPNNFIPANPLITPIHIQPEWYFLFAYAILRSMPNKFGGVIALIISIIIIIFLPLIQRNINSFFNYPPNQFLFWLFINTFFILTWLGSQPIEYPYINISQYISFIYFIFFILIYPINKLWDMIIFYK